MTPVTLLIDGDLLAFKLTARDRRMVTFGEHAVEDCSPLEDLQDAASDEVNELARKLEANRAIVCVGDDLRCWRKEILPSYKGNRKYGNRPEHLYPLKDWLNATYGNYRRPTLEGDDVMGILATHPSLIPGHKVIVSIDKDMRQIPGHLYDGRQLLQITPGGGDYWHMVQTITGDRTDNYFGCPGAGPSRARKWLRPAERPAWWPVVVDLYTKAGLTEADALVQARVARICRWTDYDYSAKRVKLWTPQEPA